MASEVLATEPYSIDRLDSIQPYQAYRKKSAIARKFAVNLLGGKVPKFLNYRLTKAAYKGGININLRAFFGTFFRKLKNRL